MRVLHALIFVGIIASLYGCSGLSRSVSVSPEEAAREVAAARAALERRDLKGASDALETARKGLPNDPTVHLLSGMVRYGQSDLTASVESYMEAIRLEPANAEAHNNLGNVFRDLKQYDEAEKHYQMATESDKKFSFAYTNWALMLEGRNTEKAIEVMRAGITALPGDLNLQLVLVDLYRNAGEVLTAREVVEEILRVHPTYEPAQRMQKEFTAKQ